LTRAPFYPDCALPEPSAKELLQQSAEEHLDAQAADVDWHAALCGLTIVRYLAEHVTALPLGVMARLVSSNDTIMALLPLVDRPPWLRTHKGQVRRRVERNRGFVTRELIGVGLTSVLTCVAAHP
jgi:hypothetical protein